MTSPAAVLAHARARPASLGSGRLICIDGPDGSGKTTLATEVADLSDAPVVHMDDLYPGWDGLFDVEPHVLGVLLPLTTDTPGHYRRYDWEAGDYLEAHRVEPTPLLVLEGVGAGNRAWRHLVTTLVWVEAPSQVRLGRGVARDGEGARDRWLTWMRDEELLFAREQTRAAADLLLDTAPA